MSLSDLIPELLVETGQWPQRTGKKK